MMRACSNSDIVHLYSNILRMQHKFRVVDDDVLSHLPFCRQNLLMISNWFYQSLFFDVTDSLLNNKKFEMWSSQRFRNKYFEISIARQISNLKFVEFFVTFFTPLYLCMKQKIEYIEQDSSLELNDKFYKVTSHINNLYNLIALQLFGLDISCNLIQDFEICNQYDCTPTCKKFGCKECNDEVSNTIVLFVNPIYYEAPGLFDKIVNSLQLIKDKNSVILFVDYTYCVPKNSDGIYSWEKTGAYQRYLTVKNYVAEIYFMNNLEKVDFGSYKEKLDSYIIRNDKEYYQIMEHWKKYNKPLNLNKIRKK